MYGDFEARSHSDLITKAPVTNKTVKAKVEETKPPVKKDTLEAQLQSTTSALTASYIERYGKDFKSNPEAYEKFIQENNKLRNTIYTENAKTNTDPNIAAVDEDELFDSVWSPKSKKAKAKITSPYKQDKDKKDVVKAKKDQELQSIIVEDKHGKEQVDGLTTIASGIESLKEAFFSIFGDGEVFTDIKTNLEKQLAKEPVQIVQNNNAPVSTASTQRPPNNSSPTLNVHKAQYRSS